MPDLYLPWTVQLAADEAEGQERTGRKFSGIAATIGATDDGRDYAFAPGAFDAAVKAARQGRWPAMLFQHGGGLFGGSDEMMPVGAWQKLTVTGDGDSERLEVEGELADTTRGRELAALLRMQPRPAIDGLSIGFVPTRIKINERPKEGEKRRLFQSIDVIEISLVTFPAMGAARISDVQGGMTERMLERRLVRDAGLSRREARDLMARGASALLPERDAGPDASGLVDALRRAAGTINPTR